MWHLQRHWLWVLMASDMPVSAARDEREWTLVCDEITPTRPSGGVGAPELIVIVGGCDPGLAVGERVEVVPKSVLVAERQAREDAERMNDILEGERDKAEDARSEVFESETQKHDDLIREYAARMAAETDRDRYRKALERIDGRAEHARCHGNFGTALIAIRNQARAALYPNQEGGGDG